MDLKDYHACYLANLERMQAAVSSAEASVFNKRSPVWTGILAKRPEFASFNDILAMFSGQSKVFGSASGGSAKEDDRLKRYKQFVDRFSCLMTPQDMAAYAQSAFGAPWMFDYKGYTASEWFLYNAGITTMALKTLQDMDFRKSKARVLEIGAGYGGMASLLLGRGLPETYHFIDLHENLFLTLMYLSYHFPCATTAVATGGEKRATPAKLNFYLPAHGESVPDGIDLALNFSSLGEMPKSTAQAYVDLVSRKLSPDGMFLSHNCVGAYTLHRSAVESDTSKRMSDLGYGCMEVKYLAPTPVPYGLYAEIHHWIGCSPKTSDSPRQDEADLNTLGFLIDSLLSTEIQGLCRAYVSGDIREEQRVFLDAARRMFEVQNPQEKLSALDITFQDPDCAAAAVYLQSCIGLAYGDAKLFLELAKNYVAYGRSPAAVIWSALCMQVVEEVLGQPSQDFQQRLLDKADLAGYLIASGREFYGMKTDPADRLVRVQSIVHKRLDRGR